MNSIEKVRQAIDRVEEFADDQSAGMTVQAAAGLLTLGRGHLEALLPTDPEELDGILEQGAAWLLSLKSDEPAELEAGAPDPQQVS